MMQTRCVTKTEISTLNSLIELYQSRMHVFIVSSPSFYYCYFVFHSRGEQVLLKKMLVSNSKLVFFSRLIGTYCLMAGKDGVEAVSVEAGLREQEAAA